MTEQGLLDEADVEKARDAARDRVRVAVREASRAPVAPVDSIRGGAYA
jgi:TPP-dependent pyruvate/acetoin dehydrogenase alpha subunit